LEKQKIMSQKLIAEKWFDAFNRHNLEDLLSLYDDQAEHYSPKLKVKQPETRGLIKGKTQLRAWWADSFSSLPSLKYYPNIIMCDGNKIFMEYLRKVDNQDDIIVGELLILENGKIIASKVYHS
jgi:hypothetical protein